MIYIIDDETKTVKRVLFGSDAMYAARNVYMTLADAESALAKELQS